MRPLLKQTWVHFGRSLSIWRMTMTFDVHIDVHISLIVQIWVYDQQLCSSKNYQQIHASVPKFNVGKQ